MNPVEHDISVVSAQLTLQRQKISEVHLESDQKTNLKDSFDLITSSKQQFHHVINDYFKEVADNFVKLQSKYPNQEVIDSLYKKADKLTEDLEQNHEPANLQSAIEELDREVEQLQTQALNTPKFHKEIPPQIKVNNRVVEGLYLTLNEYASVQWPGDVPLEQMNKVTIDQAAELHHFLPLIDDQHQSYALFDIQTRQYNHKPFQGKSNIDYQPTIILGTEGNIYFAGGVAPSGHISGAFHQLNTSTGQLIRLPDMTVKRQGASGFFHNNCLYVLGGKTNNNVKTKLCERFNLATQKWEPLPKLNQARSKATASVIGQDIYIFFGLDSENQNTTTVEKLSLNGKWELIQLINYLPGFDVSDATSIAINASQIIIFGGIRYSLYFNDQMYFNRKIIAFNVTNQTFSVLENLLPLDFIPMANPIIYNQEVYSIGYIMKQTEDKPMLFLDGGFIIKISQQSVQMIKYVPSVQ